MAYWIWLVAGIVLVALEVFVPSDFFLFILGLAAGVTGLFALATGSESLVTQGIVYGVSATIIWVAFGRFRRSVLRQQDSPVTQVVGSVVKVSEAIAPGQVGSGELWGAPWRIENVDSRDLTQGCEAVVVSAEGITLKVKHKV